MSEKTREVPQLTDATYAHFDRIGLDVRVIHGGVATYTLVMVTCLSGSFFVINHV